MQWEAKPSSPRSPEGGKTRANDPRLRNQAAYDKPIFADKDAKRHSIGDDYDITEKLGVGSFGVVKKGKHRVSGIEVAVKAMRKADCKPEELKSEVNLLRIMKGYSGVVSLEDVYETHKDVSLVMEFISGGELFDAIVENEFYSERDAADLVRQVVTTVEHVHSKNIVHRDLKPENLLFEKKKVPLYSN